MKVFSLQAPIYRGAWLSSRLTAQTSQLAAVRRDALERWRRARSRGLSAEEAARAVGASRASLYRWEKRLEPRSRRPHRHRQPTWTSALMRKIERLRADHPMWGKRKLAVLLRREGIDVSVSMVGRILTKLMARGVVTPVPMLRRKSGPRRSRIMGQRHAKRLPKGMKPIRPGELVQIDTLFVNVAPDKAVKHFTGPMGSDQRLSTVDPRLLGRAHLSRPGARIDFLIVEVEGTISAALATELGIVALTRILRHDTTGRCCGPAGNARHTNAKKPRPKPGLSTTDRSCRSEVALNAETRAPLVLFARRERACLSTRRDGRDHPSRNAPETRALVQV